MCLLFAFLTVKRASHVDATDDARTDGPTERAYHIE